MPGGSPVLHDGALADQRRFATSAVTVDRGRDSGRTSSQQRLLSRRFEAVGARYDIRAQRSAGAFRDHRRLRSMLVTFMPVLTQKLW